LRERRRMIFESRIGFVRPCFCACCLHRGVVTRFCFARVCHCIVYWQMFPIPFYSADSRVFDRDYR
jgi:hypothetical protein